MIFSESKAALVRRGDSGAGLMCPTRSGQYQLVAVAQAAFSYDFTSGPGAKMLTAEELFSENKKMTGIGVFKLLQESTLKAIAQ